VKSKLVFGENISQAAQFVQSGNSQAGLIALSLALSAAMKNGKRWDIPLDSYPSMEQAVVILKSSPNEKAALSFLAFLKSPQSRATFDRYGYAAAVPPSPPPDKSHERRSALSFLCALPQPSPSFFSPSPCPLRMASPSARGAGNFFSSRLWPCRSCSLPPSLVFYAPHCYGSARPARKNLAIAIRPSARLTFAGLVLASMLYSLPFAVQPLVASFESLDRRLLDASAVLGADRARTFLRIILPLAWPGILTAVVLSFAHTLGEFGVVLMVGGNLPGITRTVSIDIYDRVQALDYAAAHQTALLLLLISFVVLSIIYGVNRRVWSPGRRNKIRHAKHSYPQAVSLEWRATFHS